MNDRSRLVAAVVLAAGAAAAGVALLATSGWLISRAAEHPPVLYLLVAVVAVRTFGLLRGVLRYLERLVGHDLALRRQDALRQRVYAALSASTWAGRRSGDLLSRVVNDVAAAQDRVVRVVLPMASAAVVLLGTSALLALASPLAAGLLLLCSFLGAVAVPAAAGRLARQGERAIAGFRGELAEVTAEAGRAAPDVLAYGAAGTLLARVRLADARLRDAEQRRAWVAGLAAAAQLVTTGLAVGGGLLVGARAVADGRLAPVLLAVLVLTPLALHEVVGTLPAAVTARDRTAAALARVDELLTAAPVGRGDQPPPAAADGPAGGLDLVGLSAGWPGHDPVVRGLTLHVGPGERVALTGASGTGKTTVAATVLGLLPPVGGQVRARGSVGYLAQDAHLFDTTVAQNLRIGRPGATPAEIREVLRRVRLDLDPERRVGENGSRLSGGEARRLALARLLLRRDAVLVLDEPTEHLDRPTADALVDDLLAAAPDAAVLVISHDAALLERCDRVVSLDGRRVQPVSVATVSG